MAKIQTSLGLSVKAKQMLDYYASQNGKSNNEFIEELILSLSENKQEIYLGVSDVQLFVTPEKDGSVCDVTLWESFSGSVWGKFNTSWESEKIERLTKILKDLSELFVEMPKSSK